MKINKILVLLFMFSLLPLASAGASNLHMLFTDGTTTINATDICLESGACLTDAGAGDITAVNTAGPYLYGGASSGAVSLLLNGTLLNSTIDSRAGGDNSSWSEVRADTLYADISVIGDNSTWAQSLADTLYAILGYGDNWNETYANTLYADISIVTDNSSWSESYASGLYVNLTGDIMTGDLSTSGTFNGAFNWTSADNYNIFNGSALYFNQSKLETTYYNATAVYAITGTPQGTVENLQAFNGGSYNISEVASAFDIRINFTNVGDLNQVIYRFKTEDPNQPHSMHVQIWSYDDSDWHGLAYEGAREHYGVFTYPLYDSDEHISGGIVQLKIYIDGGLPPQTYKWQFDWITVADGLSTPSSSESDPFSFHINQSINNSGYNISADYIFGNGTFLLGVNESWTQIYADTQYRVATWDNFTGIPTATPTNGDTTHLSTADQIYDWAVGLFLQAIDYTNIALTNISETFELNVTMNELVFNNSVSHTLRDNSTCIIIKGSTSVFEVC